MNDGVVAVEAATVSLSPLNHDGDAADENQDRCSPFANAIVKPPSGPHATRRNETAVAIFRENDSVECEQPIALNDIDTVGNGSAEQFIHCRGGSGRRMADVR